MNAFMQTLLRLIQDGSIYIGNGVAKEELEKQFIYIIGQLEKEGWEWAVSEIYEVTTYTLGDERAYKMLHTVFKQYGNNLTMPERQTYIEHLKELEADLKEKGINPQDLVKERKKITQNNERKKDVYTSNSSPSKAKQEAHLTNTSYSGADMVATINIPGKGPIVFGELANISYSVFREKVPVRSLGRVSMKGYTRGMRTISGILSFAVFDESIVYRCMEELKKHGYRMLMDEMPLFDITITMANEYGNRSTLTIYGVTTYTEGMVLSVNDMMTQNVYEFYALDIDPIAKME